MDSPTFKVAYKFGVPDPRIHLHSRTRILAVSALGAYVRRNAAVSNIDARFFNSGKNTGDDKDSAG